jgi:hypothetical protein
MSIRQTPPDDRITRRLLSWPTLVATAVAAIVLGLVLWRAFDIDWGEFRRNAGRLSPVSYALALAVYYASFWVRGLRWRLIARTAGINGAADGALPGPTRLGGMILVGWFANSVAFLRVGDAYRGWALSRQTGGSIGESLGTVLAERVQDTFAVLLLVLAASAWIATDPDVEVPGWVLAVAFGLVAALLVFLVAMRYLGLRLARRLPGRLQAAYANFQRGTLQSFSPRDLPLQVTLGLVGWMAEMLRFYFVADGLGVDISFGIIMFAALANAMLTTIPTPGGFGFVEGGVTGLLVLMGLDDTTAFSLTVIDRTISWVSVIVFGGLLFFLWHVLGRGRARRPVSASQGPDGGSVAGR